jgi:hypothetical protein
MKIKDININEKTNVCLCEIANFSNEFKELIRNKLTKICYGIYKSKEDKALYSYKNTIKEFIKRYSTKSEEIKKGMIGELLAHVLFVNYRKNIIPVSPFFNLEEESIKKGFDILLFDKKDKEIWLSEVKSGETDKSSDSKTHDLLNLAKRDVLGKINNNVTNIWHNAINCALIALSSDDDIKGIINKILNLGLKKAMNYENEGSYYNVVLVSVLFNTISDKITFNNIKDLFEKMISKKLFKKLIVFSIHKNTHKKIESFLYEESKD